MPSFGAAPVVYGTTTGTIAGGATNLGGATEVIGRKARMMVYPRGYAGVIYVGGDASVSSTNYAFYWMDGAFWIEEGHDMQSIGIRLQDWWFVVTVDGGGFTWGVN